VPPVIVSENELCNENAKLGTYTSVMVQDGKNVKVKKYSCNRCYIKFDAIAFQSVKNKHAKICSGKPSGNEKNEESESTLQPRYCYLCDYVTPSQNKVRKDQVLRKHFESCHSEQKFICTDCGKCFPMKQSLIEHMESIHGKKKQYFDIKCPHCDFSSNRLSEIGKHVSVAHKSENQSRSSYTSNMVNTKQNPYRNYTALMTREGGNVKVKGFSCNRCSEKFDVLDFKTTNVQHNIICSEKHGKYSPFMVHKESGNIILKKYTCPNCNETFDAFADASAFESVKNKHDQICSGKQVIKMYPR
jgi:uncharacterized C2H2 Zn-finger protein